MKADYFNNSLMPMLCPGVTDKWYEVARTKERSLFKKLDIFVYLSDVHRNTFKLLYVSIDDINRRMTKCYHGKFVIRRLKNYLIIRNALWRKKFLILDYDESAGIISLVNKRKSKCWILSKKLPYDKVALDKILDSAEKQKVNINNIEFFYI